ncbi:MAG: chitobiase/beta-hexosaminidase C-terminal domain-containing protein [Candidatus Sulfotelmatobacter sp.]
MHKRFGSLSSSVLIPHVSFIFLFSALLAVLGMVLPISLCAQTVDTTISLPAEIPRGVAVNPVTNKIYVANSQTDNVTVIDGASDNSTTVAVGSTPFAIAVNAETNQIYAANYNSNNVSVIDGPSNTVVATVSTGVNPSAVAVNPITNTIYVADSGDNTVTVIHGTSNIPQVVSVGAYPYAIAVNPVSNKIYVANLVGITLSVIDGNSNLVVATVPTGFFPREVAVNPVTNTIYVINDSDNTVSVIAGSSNTAVATVPTGVEPYAIALNPVTNKIYVANNIGGYATVIDGATNVASSIPTGANSYGVAVNPVTNQIYVNNQFTVTAIDGGTNNTTAISTSAMLPDMIAVNPVTNKIYAVTVGGTVAVIDGSVNNTATVSAGYYPFVAAVNPVTNKIYIGYDSTAATGVLVIDGATGNTSTINTGSFPASLAVNPVTNKIYVANCGQGGTVTVIDGVTTNTTTLNAGAGACGLAVNPATDKIYVPHGGGNTVTVIDGATNNMTTVPGGSGTSVFGFNETAVNPVTNKIYVPNWANANVTVIDGVSNTSSTIGVGNNPYMAAVNAVTNKIYVTNDGDNTVTVIDGATNNTTTVNVGNQPLGIAVNPITNKIYVANVYSNSVTVIDGLTTNTINVPVGTYPETVAVNSVTNQIYVPSVSNDTVTVINGATNTTSTVPAGLFAYGLAINPVTNQVFVPNMNSYSVTIITPNAPQNIPFSVQMQGVTDSLTISGLAIFSTYNNSPSFTATANSNYAPTAPAPSALYYQLDTTQGPWQPAVSTGPGGYSFSLATVPQGVHIVYAYSVYGDEGTAESSGYSTGNSPESSTTAAYTFAVFSLPTATTVTADVNPQVQGQNVTFTADVQPTSGTGIPTGAVTFFDGSTKLDVASLDGSGHAVFATTALAEGWHSITAAYNGDTNFAGSASVLTEQITPILVYIAVSPASPTLSLPGTVQLIASGYYTNNNSQNLTTTATWISSNPGVATVASGLVTAVASGTTNITAIFSGITSNSAVVTVPVQNPAAAPIFSPFPSNYTAPQTVKLTDTSAGVTIYYTTDGSMPSATHGTAVASGSSITLTGTTTINAMAAGGNYGPGAVSSGTYTLQSATPGFSPFPSSYNPPQTVKLTDSTPNASIYYTTDGSTPSANNGILYSAPITLTTSMTIKAIAIGTGLSSSGVATGIYTLQAMTPGFSPFPSSYNPPQTVKLSDSTPNTSIYYTVDGSTPSATNGSLYSGPITLTAASTPIKAVAIGTGLSSSNVASGTYTLQAMTPGFSPFPSSYSTPQTVKVSDSTSGAAIYYTTDGSTPSATNGTLYSGPIAVTTTTTIKAVAVGTAGYNSSAVASGTYSIQ